MDVKYRYTRSYRDRHGKLRIEYRRGGRTIPLHGEPGTAEFQAAYDAAHLRFAQPQSPALARTQPNTLRWLAHEYLRSAEFGQLAPMTQGPRRGVLQHILNEPLRPQSDQLFGECPLARLSAAHIRVLRDRKRAVPDAANTRIKVLRVLLQWGLEHEQGVSQNVARDVPKLRVREGGYHAWTSEERRQFERHFPIGTKARLAYALLFHTGQRRSDIVLLGRQHIHQGKLRLTQQKNRRRRPITLELPILPELQAVLDQSALGTLTFLETEYGRPFAVAGFGNWFRDRCNEAGLPHCSAHGLRKSAATAAAENGATAHELMAIFGWITLKEAERYTQSAERAKLAERGMGTLVALKAGTRSV